MRGHMWAFSFPAVRLDSRCALFTSGCCYRTAVPPMVAGLFVGRVVMSDAASSEVSGSASTSPPVIHLSALLGQPVVARSGDTVGKVEDVVVRLAGADVYPPVTGLVAGIGGNRAYVSWEQIAEWAHGQVL